ncbi:CST complex subunit CTC1 [Rhinophrynus dorsalis]
METEETLGVQVTSWLESAQQHVRDHLLEGEEPTAAELGNNVIKCLGLLCPQLPLSYSFTSISQLLTLQLSPCVSLLGWGTERFRRWCKEGVEHVKGPPSQTDKLLPRVRLLLLGYLTDRPDGRDKEHDGNLYVRDKSGCIPCEMTQCDLSLLGSLVLFPCWSYILPQSTVSAGGYLEVLSPPVVINPSPVIEVLPDPEACTPHTPRSALLLLKNRSGSRRLRVSVSGELSRVTSLLNIRQKKFFFLFLEDHKSCVPVIVQDPSKLSWYHALRVGETYKVTSLCVSSLHGSSRQVFAITSSSRLHSCHPSPLLDSSEERPEARTPSVHEKGGERPQQEKVRENLQKEAKTLTYQGVLTRVINARAGLYELDRKVTLCTAYLQLANGGRGLREGARLEVSDAHLQQSPSPLHHRIVLSCCLRSRVRVSKFSQLCVPFSPVSASGNLYLHLLFHYRLRLPEYLWASDITEKLREKLYPHLITQRCLSGPLSSGPKGVLQRLLHEMLSSFSQSGQRSERDLRGEIVGEPHNCPLQDYSPLTPPWSLPPLSLLPSLVSDNQHLRSEEASHSLLWSLHALWPQDLPSRPLLLGVLHASSSGSLLIKDQTLSLPCLVLPRPPIAWIGCVLVVSRYELITERIQSTESGGKTRSKSYIIFLARDAQILHPSHDCTSCPHTASDLPPPCKMPRLGELWASRLFLLEGVEGWQPRPGQEKGLQFQARATWLGAPHLYNGGDERREEGGIRGEDKILTKDLEKFHPQTDQSLPMSFSPLSLPVPSEWTLQDAEPPWLHSHPQEEILSVSEVLDRRSTGSLLSVTGVVSHRSMCDMNSSHVAPISTHVSETFLPHGVSLKVTLAESSSPAVVSAYMDMSRGPYPLGLLPGATVLLQGLERKVSRSGSVYLRSVPVSCVSILSPPTPNSYHLTAPPFALFAQLPGSLEPRRAVCSIACVINVTLSWVCSSCGDIFRSGNCERFPSCPSQSGVFRAKAWVKAEDGTGEAQVNLQDEAVSLMMGISPGLWEALQGQVLSRGELQVQNRGKNWEVPSEERNEDSLSSFVTFLMSRPAVSRPLILTFTQRECNNGSKTETSHLRRFNRGDRDYITRVPSCPTLTCLNLQEAEPRALCHMILERSQSDTN